MATATTPCAPAEPWARSRDPSSRRSLARVPPGHADRARPRSVPREGVGGNRGGSTPGGGAPVQGGVIPPGGLVSERCRRAPPPPGRSPSGSRVALVLKRFARPGPPWCPVPSALPARPHPDLPATRQAFSLRRFAENDPALRTCAAVADAKHRTCRTNSNCSTPLPADPPVGTASGIMAFGVACGRPHRLSVRTRPFQG